jgi:hypothetical protein
MEFRFKLRVTLTYNPKHLAKHDIENNTVDHDWNSNIISSITPLVT